MLSVLSDDHFMKIALQEAESAFDNDEIPVGAAMVANGRVIAKANNQTEQLNDVTAHAEMIAITAAASALGGKYLRDCTLYVTLEPCVMCAGALRWAQLGRLVYGAQDEKAGYTTYSDQILHPKTKVSFGVSQDACQDLLKRFFKEKRKRQNDLRKR
jgi:tRNA(adenine34) deaminase